MKRINNLYDKICDTDNIYNAYLKAKQGKSHSYGVLCFEKYLVENIIEIQEELISETYKTSEYENFMIHDPKERLIFRLPFKDRVVQHAIMNILEPIWNSIFASCTYSCIKGRGIHGVLRHLKRDLKDVDNTKYCLKLDIKKFYPSVNHEVLKEIIRRKIKDNKLLRLLDGIIDSAPGVPIGNYLSQFFANLYLAYFDHWIKEDMKVNYYYRYADDLVFLSSDKPYLHNLLSDVRNYLRNNLKLELKHNHQVFPVDDRGIDFVGYVFYHTHIKMRKSIKKNFCRKASKLNKRSINNQEYKQQLCSWLGWAKHCNSKNLIKKIVKYEKIF